MRRQRPRRLRRPQTVEEPLPVALINPSVDVQVGTLLDRRWRSQLSEDHHLQGLQHLTPASPLPTGAATWGAHVAEDAGRPVLDLASPGDTYRAGLQPDLADVVARAGRVLVIVSETAKVADLLSTGRGDAIADAIAAEQAYGAWAEIGGSATEVAFQRQDDVQPEHDLSGYGASPVRSTGDINAFIEDVAVEARRHSRTTRRSVSVRSPSTRWPAGRGGCRCSC
jgi:hypothetical protein